jgi:release factor glutamine methyltransferase
MPETWTIRRILEWMSRDFAERGLPGPRLDAELLVAHGLGKERVALYMDLERPLGDDELTRIRELVKRRRAREPMAYIIGEREFWKRPFEVSTAVLVPRPDTEVLVSTALQRLPAGSEARVLDLCTGSGILAVTLAAERPLVRAIATDLSAAALEVAARNAARHGVASRVELRRGDLFDAVSDEAPFDLVVSNPPYIPTAEIETLDADVRAYEPRMALDGGADGFGFHRRLVDGAPALLAAGGSLLVEVGAGQADALAKALEARGSFEDVCTIVDFGGIERVVAATRRSG